MKILTTKQTRGADAYTIQNEPIKSIDLMERASQKCVDWLTDKYETSKPVVIFSGIGNNGGDGLVIGRYLIQKGYNVTIYIVQFSNNYTEDFKVNLNRLKSKSINLKYLTEQDIEFSIDSHSVVIDAIFGSGLSRPISGYVADIVYKINKHKSDVVAIDIPSGLFSEANKNSKVENIVHANYTLTFQQPKLTMLFPENFKFVGYFQILDIGLHLDYLRTVETSYHFVTEAFVKKILKIRSKFSHKGTFGHALLIAGSTGKMGAEILAARACLRAGVGLLTVQLPKNGLNIMQTAVPEAMCIVDESEDVIAHLSDISTYNCVGIGPGLGIEQETSNVLKLLIQNSSSPLVIDADALNILSENPTWLSFLPAMSVLTPHPKEFERLFGKWSNDEERLEKQQQAAIKNNIIIVLKGANTSIAVPDGTVYFNSTGNAGMATAGSGDVLTGIITSLLAQSYTPIYAAILGVYIHGLSGDLAKKNVGINALIASDIVNSIPKVFKYLENS
ncbi:MAG: bifunctional ADP-dependent NAD(P)H-hydrate dehydratase/NAD(P)H-hydrate epimerase [Flavobacteriales bacterium]|nr:MAG: bifunctional ADP-dependent NAD(P)H-hydrate dehydratase/NAD(P)H-hydrate epimerase [Flavobacteriales bacterium]